MVGTVSGENGPAVQRLQLSVLMQLYINWRQFVTVPDLNLLSEETTVIHYKMCKKVTLVSSNKTCRPSSRDWNNTIKSGTCTDDNVIIYMSKWGSNSQLKPRPAKLKHWICVRGTSFPKPIGQSRQWLANRQGGILFKVVWWWGSCPIFGMRHRVDFRPTKCHLFRVTLKQLPYLKSGLRLRKREKISPILTSFIYVMIEGNF